MTVLIIANGVMEEVGWIRPYLATATAIIAADGGSRYLHQLDVPPTVLVGDLDSVETAVVDWLTVNQVPILSHPVDKDETDLELALRHAVETYPDEILLFGVLGGRLDQMVANLLLLAHPGLNGRLITIVTPTERAWLIRTATTIQGQPNDTLSLIPLTPTVQINQTQGLKWPLRQESLTFGYARGISNQLTKPEALVEISSGLLLCIHQTRSPHA